MNLGSASVFLVAVSFVSPTATIRHVDAQANVVYMQPAAKTSYMEVKVQAEVTFPDVYAVDVITPTDLVTLATFKGNTETLDTNEAFSDLFSKVLSDSQSLADSITSITAYIRAYSDSIVNSDAVVLLAQMAKDDVFSTVDSTILANSKGLIETFSLTDNMDGILAYDIIKSTSENLTQTDSYAVVFSTTIADNTSLTSNGFVLVQSYSDLTYFLEDYVGSSTAFT